MTGERDDRPTYRRVWVFSWAPGARLARDIPGGAALALLVTGIPPRVASILWPATIVTFAAFPVWAQVLILAAYTGQLGAETWGGTRDRFMAASVSFVAATMGASLFAMADPLSGATWQWIGHAAMQLTICFALARRVGREDHAG